MSQSTQRRSIPTRYKGILFRSKLEADWARAFDELRLPWEYEKEGRYFSDVFYLPDFYLPQSKQFAEVKAIWEPADYRKAFALCGELGSREGHFPLVALEPGGVFRGMRSRPHGVDFHDWLIDHPGVTMLGQCATCRAWWFFDEDASWMCLGCRSASGRPSRQFWDLRSSPLVVWKGAA